MNARKRKLARCLWLVLPLALLACDKSASPLTVSLPGGVTAIVFIRGDRHNAHFVRTVRDPADVRRIVAGISIGRETKAPLRVFARRVVFLRGQEEYVRISFDGDVSRGKYYLRYREKLYETTRETYELLASYFAGPGCG